MNVTGAEIVVHTDGNELLLTNLKVSASKAGDSRERTRRYGFDYCFNSSSVDSEAHATQEKVYETLGRSVLDAVFSGFNACLVAYGQSASGKTYTMMGPKSEPGLTPRLCEGLFLRLSEEQKKGGQFEIAISYLEIYNERVRDLLKPSTSSGGLRVREHPRLGPYVQGLTCHTVSTLGSLMSYVEEGTRARKTASTSQNPTSSRSHALLTVSLTSRSENSNFNTTTGIEKKQNCSRGARLHLVDLAGSERAGNTNYGLHRLKEGANINKSLVALGNVISALAERGATGSGPGRRFIPYRDSALTWLLKDALGGNATTIMLATISPASGSYNETAHTLRFAHRAQSVVNRPVVNEDPVARVIRELRAEITRLTSLLSEKESVGERKSSCCCKQRLEEEIDIERFPIDVDECENYTDDKPSVNISNEVVHRTSSRNSSRSTLHRRCNSDESLSFQRPKDKKNPSALRFGSLRSLDSDGAGDSSKECNHARFSTVSCDRVNSLALVDIPTLVAVLIKPDQNHTESIQIEEISGGNVLESSLDIENIDASEFSDVIPPLNEYNDTDIAEVVTSIDDKAQQPEVQKSISKESLASLPKDNEVVLKNWRPKEELVEQDGTNSIDQKKSSNLNGSKKFGSSESFDSLRKNEGNRIIQRSYTNLHLERDSSATDKTSRPSNFANLTKVKRTWSPRGSTTVSPKKIETVEKDVPKKVSKDLNQQKTSSPLRKQDSESPKRKISKDGRPIGSKDEAVLTPAPKLVRKGSLSGEVTCRTQTPIQRTNRRAKIVAAVTERLYSTKKVSEDITTSSLGPDLRSSESAEFKLANATRMRLQEISRKMLAKRRKTCVNTQTDVVSTVRVKDTGTITDDPQVVMKDVAVITDYHENYRELATGSSIEFPVTRVKEISTSTDAFVKTVRCKDVEILTEDYDDIESSDLYLDAGVFSKVSLPQRGSASLADSSTNTTNFTCNKIRCSSSQTIAEDIMTDSKLVQTGCNACHNVRESCYQVPISNSADRSVICITLPDMLSITIESPNTLESKIAITEGTTTPAAEEKVVPKVRDSETQTESREKTETTDRELKSMENNNKFNYILFNDLSTVVTTRSASCQSDGKTFRIENIFKDPKNESKTVDRTVVSDLLPDLTEHIVPKTSFKLTNSVGTSFTPETMERSTEIERVNFIDSKILRQPKEVTWKNLKLYQPSSLGQDSFCNNNLSSLLPVKDTRPIDNSAKLKTNSKIEDEDLKSPLLVAKMVANNSVEIDSNFSDDSLDPDEINSESVDKKTVLRLDDTICPPDVVAHTKKDRYESRTEEDFANDVVEFPRSSMSSVENTRVHDYAALLLGRTCFNEIGQGDSGDTSRIDTPESEEGRSQFKKKVSFSNSKLPDRQHTNDIRKPKSIIKNTIQQENNNPRVEVDPEEEAESNNPSKISKPNSSTPLECSTSENSFRDDISSISESSETIRSGILYNSDEDSDEETVLRKREESDMKRVRFTTLLFGERGESETSDSEGCENVLSDDESFCCDMKRKLFASYLDEATAFVHNMNTMNEYVNASRLFQEQKDCEEDYIEYNGHKISLKDDTEKYLNEETLDVPVDSYRNCLKGIAKLEKCIEKAVKHDKLLFNRYGIRLESAATSFSLVDLGKDSSCPNTGLDFLKPIEVPTYQNLENFNSDVENFTGITDAKTPQFQKGSSDLEENIFQHLMESAAPRQRTGCAKPYFRRSLRTSDLSVRNPSSYSRLRKKHYDYGRDVSSSRSYPDKKFNEESKWYANSDAGSPQSSTEIVEPRDLKIPQCFLVVPDIEKSSSVREYRSDGGTSSSEAVGTSSESIDNVASVRNKYRYPGSPRAKLLQLVSERRQIVHRSRNANLH